MKNIILGFLLAIIITPATAQNADSAYFVNNYKKQEVYITMRDGVKLFTSIYTPTSTAEAHPMLMTRTPYSCSPYGESNYMQVWKSYRMDYVKSGYTFVTQDVRGRYMSYGEFEDVRPFNKNKKGKETDEASDTYDTVDWLVQNVKNNNGNVGVFGTSYPGFYSTEAALSGHPAVKAVSPQAPVTDWFMGDDFHHNGAFFPMDGFNFYPTFGKPHPAPTMDYGSGFSTKIKDNYKFYLEAGPLKNLSSMIGDSIKFWHEMYQHPTYDDWWQARNARVGLYNVKPAMLWVGGNFDAEDCFGAWACYKATRTQSPTTKNRVVMGPWYHGQWSREGSSLGHVQYASNTSDYYQQKLEIPFFDHYLLGKKAPENDAEATVFFTGSNDWKEFNVWPPAASIPTQAYITADNKLSFTSGINGSSKAFYQYTSDPAHPVPYTEDVHNRRTREYMVDDQRFASRRPDVLTFSMPLTKDLTLAGPVIAELMVALSATDADFVVKVIDQFPDDFSYAKGVRDEADNYPMGGYQMLVRGEVMRGKFRESFSVPKAFTPGVPTSVKFALPDVAHTFKAGHTLVIQVQSSWFPLVDRNPQQFLDIYKADAKDFIKSDIKVFYGDVGKSRFILPVLEVE